MTPDLLRRARAATGLSLEAWSAALGAGRQTAHRWERGTQAPEDPAGLRERVAALLERHARDVTALLAELRG